MPLEDACGPALDPRNRPRRYPPFVCVIPRGLEVLLKKAAVDGAFRSRLLHSRTAAAAEIGLELTPAEDQLLRSIPAAQLEAAIVHAPVTADQRAALQGSSVAAMVAALGLALLPGCGGKPSSPPTQQRATPPAQTEKDRKAEEPKQVKPQQEFMPDQTWGATE